MKHGRVHWFAPADLDEGQRAYYDRLLASPRDRSHLVDGHGRLLGPFNARLLDPPLGTAVQELASVLRFGTAALPGRARELAILEVARAERSAFEWSAHERAGRAAGLTAAEIADIRSGREPPSLAPFERVARLVVRSLIEWRDLDDQLFEQAEATLGLTALFDLITLVGHYQHTALALRVWRTPLPDGETTAFDEQSTT